MSRRYGTGWAVQTVAVPALGVTVASGSLVPVTVGVVVTSLPADGGGIATGGGNEVTLATPAPLIFTVTLLGCDLAAAPAEPEVGRRVLLATEVSVGRADPSRG